MPNFNKVILAGHLTRDPEVSFTSQGKGVAKIGIAVSKKYKSKAGEDVQETMFIDVDVWGKQAESIGKYLKKGSAALIEGELKLDSWDSADGSGKRYKHKINASRVQFIGGKSKPKEQSESLDKREAMTQIFDGVPPNGGIEDDDIPF